MKQVFSLPDSAEIELLQGLLDEAGIPCGVKNSEISQTFPVVPFNAELWVENDEDFQQAHDLCEAWRHPAPAPNAGWTCPQCGELVEAQFDSCWQCGAKRDTPTQA